MVWPLIKNGKLMNSFSDIPEHSVLEGAFLLY